MIRGALRGSALLRRPWHISVGGSRSPVFQSGVYHLHVFAPEYLQLQHASHRRLEALANADALGARPERVHAAAAAGHPRRARTD